MSKRGKRGREDDDESKKVRTANPSTVENAERAKAGGGSRGRTLPDSEKLEWLNGGVPLHTYVLGPLAKAAVGAEDDDIARGGGAKNASRFQGNKVALQSGTGMDDITESGASGTYGIGPGNRAATMQNMNSGSLNLETMAGGLDAERSEPYLSGIRGGHPEIYISGIFTRDVLVDRDDVVVENNKKVSGGREEDEKEFKAKGVSENCTTMTSTTTGGGSGTGAIPPAPLLSQQMGPSAPKPLPPFAVKEVYVVVEIQRVMREVIPLGRAQVLYPQAVIDFFLHEASLSVAEEDW